MLETTNSKTGASMLRIQHAARGGLISEHIPMGHFFFMTCRLHAGSQVSYATSSIIWGGGVNHCNEWLITSSRPGGCWYFQLIKRLDEPSA